MGRPNILYTAFVATDGITPVVRRMGSSVREFAVTTTVAAGRMSAAIARTTTLIGSLALHAATMAVAMAPVFAVKAAVDFEKQMTNVATVVDTNVENMDAMGYAVLRMAKKIPKPIADLTESLYQIRSAGQSAGESMHDLELSGMLATAGLSTTAEAAKAMTSSIVSFRNEGLTADQIANSLFLTVKQGKTKMDALNESIGEVADIASESNIKLDDFLSAVAALTHTGLSASSAMLNLRQFIIALKKPSSEMADVLGSLGFKGAEAGQQLIDKYKNIGDIMMVLKTAAPAAQDNINKALGRAQALTAYTALTGNMHGQYLKNQKERTENANALAVAFTKQMQTAAGQAEIFQNTVKTLGISIGHLLIPPLIKLVNVITPIIDAITHFANNNETLIKTIAITAITLKVVRLGMIAYNTVLGFTAVLTTDVTRKEALFNMQLAATPGYARGAAAGIGLMNGAAKGLLATFARIAVLAVPIYAVMKMLDREDEDKAKMAAILPHLPESVDKEKFKKAYENGFGAPDALNSSGRGNPLILLNEDHSYDAVRDSLIEKYYNRPRKAQDSVMESLSNPYTVPAVDSIDGKVGFNTRNKQDTPEYRSANYTPKNGMQNITITLENNSGLTASVKQNSGGTAQAVPITIVSTTSKRPKQTIA